MAGARATIFFNGTYNLNKAQHFINSLVPEMILVYGEEAKKWFTLVGLDFYKNTKYKPMQQAIQAMMASPLIDLDAEDPFKINDNLDSWIRDQNVQKKALKMKEATIDLSTPKKHITNATPEANRSAGYEDHNANLHQHPRNHQAEHPTDNQEGTLSNLNWS